MKIRFITPPYLTHIIYDIQNTTIIFNKISGKYEN